MTSVILPEAWACAQIDPDPQTEALANDLLQTTDELLRWAHQMKSKDCVGSGEGPN